MIIRGAPPPQDTKEEFPALDNLSKSTYVPHCCVSYKKFCLKSLNFKAYAIPRHTLDVINNLMHNQYSLEAFLPRTCWYCHQIIGSA